MLLSNKFLEGREDNVKALENMDGVGDITEEMFTCIQEEGNCVMGIISIDKE